MNMQNLVYNLKRFKRFCLVYLLENKFQKNKTSLINAFTCNNNRVKIYQKSLSLRLKNSESMDNYMAGGHAISLVYIVSIFCFALLEYPRAKKANRILYMICSMIIIFVKFIIQLKVILIFLNENNYKILIIKLRQ